MLLTSLLAGSSMAWTRFYLAWRSHQPWIEWSDEPRALWHTFAERTVLLLMCLWLSLHLSSCFLPAPPTNPQPFTTMTVVELVIAGGGIALVLPAILLGSHRNPSEFGFKTARLGQQAADGVEGFLIALLPMMATMLLMWPYRTRDTQNPLLKLLSDSGDPTTLILIGVVAIVIAPLSEEMMFRVILQGWLTSVVDAKFAIPVVAVTFAAIHGVVDGLALLPLAFVLGYVFHRRHSFVTVVVIHGLFNATMLALALLIES
jgi:uncharacterized protein